MDQKILNFLTTNRIAVLATQLKDGSPHTAALHYSHKEEPFELYFSTENTSRKCEALISHPVKASVTIGFSEQEWITIQMDGDIMIVTDSEELKVIKAVHYLKHPHSQKYENDPSTLFLKFTPTWWRYTDYNTKPPAILSSQ